MVTMKLKSVAVMLAVVCSIGLGAWAGAGDGPGVGAAPDMGQFLAAATPQGQPKSKFTPSTPAKPPAGLELLQGRWRITAMTENGIPRGTIWKDEPGEITIRGASLTMPYRDANGGRKVQEYKIAVDDTKSPKTIDLISPQKPVGKGIYEFIAPQTMCTTCHDTGKLEPSRLESSAERHMLQFWLLSGTHFHSSCQPGEKVATGLRLALAIEGERPARFAGDKVVVFGLERVGANTSGERDKLEREKARLMALLESAVTEDQKKELLHLLSQQRVAAAELEVEEARAQLQAAAARCDEAQARVEQAGVQFTLASRTLQAAQAKLEEAEKAGADAGQKRPAAPAKAGGEFTIHIRPLAAPEKVIRLKATGSETVLEALAHAAQDMAVKPDELSAWVVRGKEILTVDLPGLLQKNETKTNYILKAGDQLFVQTKVGK